jgi:2-polyprenyl-3-methyl-5-hydroxy-6-metoxy-1,4-benzoquinol methylase
MNCRYCKKKLKIKFLDLGLSPLANNYLNVKDLKKKEKFYPLKTWFCNSCYLVQSQGFNKINLLFNSNYTYFSGISRSFSKHFKDYVIKITKFLKLSKKSFIIEIGSNDGILLKNFGKLKKNCLGIEPSKNTARECEKYGIKVLKKFFNFKLAKTLNYKKADLIIANNVFAHIPKINDTIRGLKELLSPNGCINIEFPHLLNLIKFKQFDTVYHEHFFYFSLTSIIKIFGKHNLKIWKVDKINTHGGSLRIYAVHNENKINIEKSVIKILKEEKNFGITKTNTYRNFQKVIEINKAKIIKYLDYEKKNHKKICGFGAPAKSTTLINYCKIDEETLNIVFDNSKNKYGKFIPGSKIPILKPTARKLREFDIIIIFAWNLQKEIVNFLKKKVRKNTKIATLIPNLKIINL